MLPHYAFFEALGLIDDVQPAWNSTLAGLVVLNLVDDARRDRTIIDSDWTGMRAGIEAVSVIREGSPLRRPLMKVMDGLRDGSSWSSIGEDLFSYGRALDFDGHWKLAVDVFATVADIARAEQSPKMAIEATTALGGAARRSGDWDRSAEGYAEAAHMANALGDRASGLTVLVGTANTHIARGNVPAAKQIFDEVIEEAEAARLDGVSALALHGRASIAHLQGDFTRAVTFAYRALEKTTNPNVRDQITADIAAAFQELGMRDAARDAHLIVSTTSRYQWVRWQAIINLMELATEERNESVFEQYARELKSAALDPRLRSYFLLYYGLGCRQFGREAEAVKWIAEARDFASANKINQVAFEAESALEGERRASPVKKPSLWTAPPDVLDVASAIAHMREEAISSHSVES